jgi:heptosyltransferase-3
MDGYDGEDILRQLVSIGEMVRSGRATLIKHRLGRTTAILHLSADRRSMFVYVKHDRLTEMGARALLRSVMTRSRPARTWLRTVQVQAAGISVQSPIALLEERRWGVVTQAVYVGAYSAESAPLIHALETGMTNDRQERAVILATVAKEVRLLHDRGFIHGDLKASNILVERTGGGQWCARLIDLESTTVERAVDLRDRATDLARFCIALESLIDPTERVRLLDHYVSIAPALDRAAIERAVMNEIDRFKERRHGGAPRLTASIQTLTAEAERARRPLTGLVIALDNPYRLLQATPLLTSLHREFPSMRIDVLVTDESAPLLAENGDVNKLVVLSPVNARAGRASSDTISFVRLLRLMPSCGYDMVIDLSSGWRSSLLTRATGASIRIGYRVSELTSQIIAKLGCYTYTIKAKQEQRDGVGHRLLAAQALGSKGADRTLRYMVTERERSEAETVSAKYQRGGKGRLILIDLSAQHATSRWPLKLLTSYLDLIRQQRLGDPLLVTRSPSDLALPAELGQKNENVMVMTDGPSLRLFAALIERADIVVGCHPLASELAGAVRTPMLMLLGGVGSGRRNTTASGLVIVRPYCYCQDRSIRLTACSEGTERWCLQTIRPDELIDLTQATLSIAKEERVAAGYAAAVDPKDVDGREADHFVEGGWGLDGGGTVPITPVR